MAESHIQAFGRLARANAALKRQLVVTNDAPKRRELEAKITSNRAEMGTHMRQHHQARRGLVAAGRGSRAARDEEE